MVGLTNKKNEQRFKVGDLVHVNEGVLTRRNGAEPCYNHYGIVKYLYFDGCAVSMDMLGYEDHKWWFIYHGDLSPGIRQNKDAISLLKK
jgi:hypothetical protein